MIYFNKNHKYNFKGIIMNIIFINLADESGLGNKSVTALGKKYPAAEGHTITVVHAMSEALRWRHEKAAYNWDEFKLNHLNINDINEYDQIILAVHGLEDDILYCYHEPEFNADFTRFMHNNDLAFWLVNFLKQYKFSKKELNLTLSVCYAARTLSQLNHINDRENVDFRETFAYRMVEQIIRQPILAFTINLTAYTGALGFHSETGEICVETEEQISKKLDFKHLDEQYSAKEQALETLFEAGLDEGDAEFDSVYAEFVFLGEQRSKLLGFLQQKAKEYGKVIYNGAAPNGEITIDISALAPLQARRLSRGVGNFNIEAPCVAFTDPSSLINLRTMR
jgi:hypothetical protein